MVHWRMDIKSATLIFERLSFREDLPKRCVEKIRVHPQSRIIDYIDEEQPVT